jgi:hypothetical protein
VKERAPKDMAASSRQRLLNLSRQEGRAFNQILPMTDDFARRPETNRQWRSFLKLDTQQQTV